jgi:hypothetical protein
MERTSRMLEHPGRPDHNAPFQRKGHIMAGRKRNLVDRTCEVCGTRFYAKPSRINKGGGRFCSKDCQDRSRITRFDRNCEVCGTVFVTSPGRIAKGQGRFCSKDCHDRSKRVPLIERFYRYVGPVTGTGCILWTGAVSVGGYGLIGHGAGKGGMIYANRLSYELFIGPIPDGLFALHRCDTPRCVNSFHIFIGTTADNIADMVAKGRQARGERCHLAKCTAELVQQIRREYDPPKMSAAKLAKKYGLSSSTVERMIRRQTWKHLDDEPEDQGS